jgi:hypothetical protein
MALWARQDWLNLAWLDVHGATNQNWLDSTQPD